MGKIKDKRWIGIILSLFLTIVFVAISLTVNKIIQGTPWFLFSSCLRIVFGVLILYIVKKVFGKNAKEVFCFKNGKEAVIAATGFLVYFIYFVILYGVGIKSITGLTADLFLTKVILQQLATGFYEEIHYRVLMCEGYRFTKGGFSRKLIYALISSVLFASIHIIGGWDTITFLRTGAIGFAFSAIYLQSGNILLPMILHFVYDIVANMNGFIEWNDSELFDSLYFIFEIMIAIMFLVSLIILIRKEDINDKQKSL